MLSFLTVLFLVTGLMSPFAALTASAQDATPDPVVQEQPSADVPAEEPATTEPADPAPAPDQGEPAPEQPAPPSQPDPAESEQGAPADVPQQNTTEQTVTINTTEETDPVEETSPVEVMVADEPVVVASAPTSCTVAEKADPWIKSDLDDYPPGSSVTLTGGGWVPGQKVDILVQGDDEGAWSLRDTTTADANGNLVYQFNLADWYIANYTVTATGECSTAATKFTDAQSTTLTVSEVTGAYGGSVTLTAQLTAYDPPKKANVPLSGKSLAFSLDGNSVGSAQTDANGNASKSVSLSGLAVGRHQIQVAFAGEQGVYSSSSGTNTLVITEITKAATTTTVTCPTASVTYTGAALTPCTAKVTGPDGLNQSLTVAYQNNTNAGTATASAAFAGDGNYAASSDTTTFTIAPATAEVTLGNLTHTYDGSAKAATATTKPAGLTVAITYSQNGQAVSAPTDAGSYTVAATVNYPNYTGSKTGTLVIATANQTITFGAIGDKTFGDPDFAPGATANSGLPVSYTATGACTSDGSKVHITGAGSCKVTAAQSGNSNYNAATSVEQSFNIAKANQTITFGELVGKTYGDVPFTISATASSGLAVTFSATGNCTFNEKTSEVTITGAGSCTVTASQAGDDNYNAASLSRTLEIGRANQTISFAPISGKTFNDPDITLGATASSGLGVSYTTEGTCEIVEGKLHIKGAGNCTITASQAGDDNYNPAAPVERAFTIAKAAAAITLGDLIQTYNGDPKEVTATTNPTGPTGVSISYSQNGQAVEKPTNAGDYDVVASLTNANYQAPNATGTLTIEKAGSTITVSCKTGPFTYSGTAQEPCTAAVTGAGGLNQELKVSYQNNTNAGTATASASYGGDANHLGSSGTTTFTIDQATATLTLVIPDATYDGNPHPVTVTTDPEQILSDVAITYGDSSMAPTNAGSYAVKATLSNDNYTAEEKTGTLVITKAATKTTLTCPTASLTYSGTAQEPCTAKVTGPGGLEQSLTVVHENNTNAGTATASAAFAGDGNYAASDANKTFTIAKATQTITFPEIAGKTFNDPDFAPDATVDSRLTITYAASDNCSIMAGKVHINGAGSCTITASQAGDDNHEAASAVSRTFAIAKAKATVTLSDLTPTFDGTAKLAKVTTDPAGLKVDVTYKQGSTEITGPTAAGNYSVMATVNNANYEGSESGTLTIKKAEATVSLDGASLTQTYDGKAKNATATTDPTGLAVKITYSQDGQPVTAPTNAGDYALVAKLDNPNYQAPDATGTLKIAKANQIITFTSTAPSGAKVGDTYTPAAKRGDSGEAVTFSATGGCKIENGAVKMTAAGTCTITASQGGNDNYNAAPDVTQSFMVKDLMQITGFYSPVDNAGSKKINSVKVGSTVPLKFSVNDNGTAVTDTKYIKPIQVVLMPSSGGTEEPIPVDLLATGGTTLRYDSTSGQFIYNWSTKGLKTGQTYRVTVETTDGKTISADFVMK